MGQSIRRLLWRFEIRTLTMARHLTGERLPEIMRNTVTCQCFMYIDKDKVLPKIHRLLKKDGHFCVLFMAWLPEESVIAKTSEELVLKYNSSWSGGHMTRYPLNTPSWCGSLFEPVHMLTFDLPVTFTRESWHGRMKACRGIGASSLDKKEIASWEKEHIAYLQTVPEVFDVLHYVSILDVRKMG